VRSQFLRKVTISFVVPIRPSVWKNWAPTERNNVKFDVRVFFENLSKKIEFPYNMTRKTGTLHEDQYTFMITARSVLIMRNVSDKICREN
jgi:hypothetical protein